MRQSSTSNQRTVNNINHLTLACICYHHFQIFELTVCIQILTLPTSQTEIFYKCSQKVAIVNASTYQVGTIEVIWR